MKIKSLLLSGIFTLFGIFNFSSAGSVYCDFWQCNGQDTYTYNFSSPVGKVNLSYDYSDGSELFLGINGALYSYSSPDFPSSFEGDINSIGFALLNGGPVTITFDVPVLSSGFGTFTPAVNSLKSTVYEIIPYVVYISIGFLIAVIGFYAIKWLVNWFGIKINSVFKSKRG